MTHTNIDYGQFAPDEARAKAIQDLIEWFGAENFWAITVECKQQEAWAFERFELIISIGGVQGFPVKVWYQEIWPNVSN